VNHSDSEEENKFVVFLRKRYFVVIPLAVFLFLLIGFKFRAIAVFSVFTVITFLSTYFVEITRAPLDFGLVGFGSLFFGFTLGTNYSIIIVLVGLVLAEFMAGEEIQEIFGTTIIYCVMGFIASMISKLGLGIDLMLVGIVLGGIQCFLMITVRKTMGTPFFETLLEDSMEYLLSIMYFFSFSKTLLLLLGM
jgi:hypothetical protein